MSRLRRSSSTRKSTPQESDPAAARAKAGRLYGPLGAAEALFYCRDRQILIEGPAGTGKTRGVLEKINLCLMKYDGSRALIVRKTRKSMTESVLVTLEEKVIPAGSKWLGDQQRKTRDDYRYPNGSVLVVGGMDNPDRIMSTEYDLIGIFEATELSEDDLEKLTTRLRNGVMPYQQLIADCNPGAPTHWLNKRAAAGTMTRLLSRHEDNPMLYDVKSQQWKPQGDAYLAVLDRLTGPRKMRLRFGRWVAAEGVVYEGYDADVHLIDKMPAGWESWRKVRSIDFGFVNPFVCQWLAIDGDGRAYLYREIYQSQRLVEDHAKRITELSAGEVIEQTVSDHDAEDRATLDRHGVHTTAAHKAITPGIQAVASRLEKAGDGRPRLYILRDCVVSRDEALATAGLPTCTAEEFDAYLWPKSQEGKTVKEVPVDKDNHGMDALRYMVAYLDNLSGLSVELVGEDFVVCR